MPDSIPSPKHKTLELKNGMLPIPPEFGKPGDSIFVTGDPSMCLLIFHPSDFKTLEKFLNERLNKDDQMYRLLARLVLGFANDQIIQSDGSIYLEEQLRDFAKIDQQCIWKKIGKYIKVWPVEGFTEEDDRLNWIPDQIFA